MNIDVAQKLQHDLFRQCPWVASELVHHDSDEASLEITVGARTYRINKATGWQEIIARIKRIKSAHSDLEELTA